MTTLRGLGALLLLSCSGEHLEPFDVFPDAGPPRINVCVGESASLCTRFFGYPALITYDRSDGSVHVGTADTHSWQPHPPGQTARLRVLVSSTAAPIVTAETTVDEQLRGSFRVPYCDLLPYRDDEMWFVVTVERSDGQSWGRGEARPRLTCAVPPPTACASLCAE